MEELKINYELSGKKVRLGNSDKYITFYPADANFPDRLQQAYDEIEKYTADIKPADGIENQIKQSRDADKFIKEKLDYAFGYPVCDTAFGCVSALSLDENGFYLFERFISALMPVIEKEFSKRFDKLNKRIKSYTDKKGQHPAIRK